MALVWSLQWQMGVAIDVVDGLRWADARLDGKAPAVSLPLDIYVRHGEQFLLPCTDDVARQLRAHRKAQEGDGAMQSEHGPVVRTTCRRGGAPSEDLICNALLYAGRRWPDATRWVFAGPTEMDWPDIWRTFEDLIGWERPEDCGPDCPVSKAHAGHAWGWWPAPGDQDHTCVGAHIGKASSGAAAALRAARKVRGTSWPARAAGRPSPLSDPADIRTRFPANASAIRMERSVHYGDTERKCRYTLVSRLCEAGLSAGTRTRGEENPVMFYATVGELTLARALTDRELNAAQSVYHGMKLPAVIVPAHDARGQARCEIVLASWYADMDRNLIVSLLERGLHNGLHQLGEQDLIDELLAWSNLLNTTDLQTILQWRRSGLTRDEAPVLASRGLSPRMLTGRVRAWLACRHIAADAVEITRLGERAVEFRTAEGETVLSSWLPRYEYEPEVPDAVLALVKSGLGVEAQTQLQELRQLHGSRSGALLAEGRDASDELLAVRRVGAALGILDVAFSVAAVEGAPLEDVLAVWQR